jgi:hypothetical protein
MRQQITHLDARPPAPGEFPIRAENEQGRALQLRHPLAPRQAVRHRLAPQLVQPGLRVERLELRWPAAHEQEDDALRPGRVVKLR